jgi:hypothetical protein
LRIRLLPLAVLLAGAPALFCRSAHADVSDARQDVVVITDIVDYQCTATGVADKQDIKVKIELTMPADATTGKQLSIGWRGAYASDTTSLRAPATGLDAGIKLYAYASIRGLTGLTSATGVGELAMLNAGQIIPLPTATVPLKTTSFTAGTATVRPAALNFGTRPTEPSIQCEVHNADALTTYTLTIAPGDGRPADPAPVTPSRTATATASPQPTSTVTATVTAQPTASAVLTSSPQPVQAVTPPPAETLAAGNGKVIRTPLGGAATGGGGESGPDGRMLVSTGFLLILAAATGLLLRRRTVLRR